MQVLVVFCLTASLSIMGIQAVGWSAWTSNDGPGGNGDYETIGAWGNPCSDTPTKVQVRVKNTTPVILTLNRMIRVGPQFGLTCNDTDQATDVVCSNFKVRYHSGWFNLDDPSSDDADMELRSSINQGPSITSIEFYADADATGSVTQKLIVGPDYGVACVNSQQVSGTYCKNYEVSFYCP